MEGIRPTFTEMILQSGDYWSGLQPPTYQSGNWGKKASPSWEVERHGPPICTLVFWAHLVPLSGPGLSIRTLDQKKTHLTHCCIFLLNPSTSCRNLLRFINWGSSTHRIWQFCWSFSDGGFEKKVKMEYNDLQQRDQHNNFESPWHWLHKNKHNQKNSIRCIRNHLMSR